MTKEQNSSDLVMCKDGRPMRNLSSGAMTITTKPSRPRRESTPAPKQSPQRVQPAMVIQPAPAKNKSRRNRRKSRDEVRPKPLKQFKPNSQPKRSQPVNWPVDDWEDDGAGIQIDERGQVKAYSEPDIPTRLCQEDLFRAVERYPEYCQHWHSGVSQTEPEIHRFRLTGLREIFIDTDVESECAADSSDPFLARLPLSAEPVRVETGHQVQSSQPHRLDRSEDLGTVQIINLEPNQTSCLELQLSQVPNHLSLDEFLGWCPLPIQDGVEDPFLPVSATDDQTPLLWEIYPSGLS